MKNNKNTKDSIKSIIMVLCLGLVSTVGIFFFTDYNHLLSRVMIIECICLLFTFVIYSNVNGK